MLRGDVHGRVPFALVAVLLVLSASVSAMYLAAFAHDAAERRLREAQLDALAQVADAIHAEVQAQAEVLALRAIDRGIEGLVNESRIAQAFREAFAGYVADHFPRTVRSVTVRVSAVDGTVYLVRQRVEDAVPPEDVRDWWMNGTDRQGPDPGAPEAWALVDRLAYFGIAGYVNYTLTVGGFTLRRSASLDRILPVPAPFLEAKVEQAVASGRSDLAGIGRTVKAIVATLVQLRVLQGFASPVKAGTTTRGVLTPDEVALAVNLAILLEEIRRFRSFDRDAAVALDAAYGRPELPTDASPPGADRTWTSLLERYAARGRVDPVDLYALHRGLDVERLPVGALLAQAVAALADDAVLKHLDYLGLTPLADWLVSVGEGFAATFEAFLRWLAGTPEREVAYVHQFLRELLLPTAGRTTFLGPASIALPERTYAIVDGSSAVNITVPAYGASVPFPWRDLVTREFDEFWAAHYPDFEVGVRRLHAGIRDLTNDVAARLAEDAAFVDALGGSAESLDPNDRATFLAVLAARIEKAVDEAIERLRSDPVAMDAMIAPLWEIAKELVADLVDLLVDSYPTLADEAFTIAEGERALADDVWTRASLDSDFAALGEDGRNALRTAIEADVADSGWVRSTFASRRAEDVARWSLALAAVNETVLPGTPTLRERLREAAVGVDGWLLHARSAMRGLLQEALGQEALAAHVATRLDPFLFRDVPTGRAKAEPFRVHHEPGVVREGDPDGLRIEIVDPATVPLAVDTPNVHYTRPFERSTRPFTTQWTVRMSGLVQLRVETVDRVLFGPDGPKPLAVEHAWPLEFSFNVQAYSGWNLTGVAYRASDTLVGDAWETLLSFLDVAWDALVPLVRLALATLAHLARVFADLFDDLRSLAQRLVEILSKAFTEFVDLLRTFAVGALQGTLGILDTFADSVPAETAVTFHVHGMDWKVLLNGPEGREIEANVTVGAAVLRLVLVDFHEAELDVRERFDVIATWELAIGDFRLDARFDPLTILQTTMLAGRASWADAWRAEFAGPVAEPFCRAGWSWVFGPIPVPPVGTVDVEIGAFVALRRDLTPLILDLIRRAFEEALVAFPSEPTWEEAGRLTAAFARGMAAQALELLETSGADLIEFALFVDVRVNGAGGPEGAGIRLSFVADGRALVDLLAWIVRNVLAFFDRMLDPLTPARYASFPSSVPEHVFLRAEGYAVIGLPRYLGQFVNDLGLELRLAIRAEANLPFLGALFGHDWGRPQVRFGAYAQVPAPVLGAFGVPSGMGGNLWLLRGTLEA